MARDSKIEWCDDTVNFWIGCTKVSPACDNCYAERDWGENGRRKRVTWGPHGSRSPTKNSIGQLRALNARAQREGRRRRVFINSLSDTFDNHGSITSGLRGSIFEAAKLFPHLDLLLLTKRPQNIARMLPEDWGDGYPNIWLGTTAENQEEADRRIPHLLWVPAIVRFLSCEPLLGCLDLTRLRKHLDGRHINALTGVTRSFEKDLYFGALHWVIVGGESGPGARPMHPDWARALRDQCAEAGVPFFFKQWGEWLPISYEDMASEHQESEEIAGRLHEFDDGQPMHRIGKARAGRLLDGVEHNAMPPLTRR